MALKLWRAPSNCVAFAQSSVREAQTGRIANCELRSAITVTRAGKIVLQELENLSLNRAEGSQTSQVSQLRFGRVLFAAKLILTKLILVGLVQLLSDVLNWILCMCVCDCECIWRVSGCIRLAVLRLVRQPHFQYRITAAMHCWEKCSITELNQLFFDNLHFICWMCVCTCAVRMRYDVATIFVVSLIFF